MSAMSDLGIVIAAGGSSSRYGGANKLFDKIDGIPVFIFSIADFACLCLPDSMVLVTPEAEIEEFRRYLNQYLPHLDIKVVPGGPTRCHSVRNGLNALPERIEYVAIHDAARPLATAEILKKCLEEARKYDGAIAGRPLTDTIKKTSSDQTIAATVCRADLWGVETPQVFQLNKLRKAYDAAIDNEINYTDDAGVMEACGYKLKLVHFPQSNLKITWPGDTSVAEAIIRHQRSGICRN
ncbi:MAG: 2-C-methyl-D-erythritol 4-phosphate cytidylyltransferase [Victivallales bacterium]|nr:2-C-methyl-D-erythritol 4-phosphate cytidylyltransferase [Victivallales bacterium]